MESSEGSRATEQGGQKPAADPPGPAGGPAKPQTPGPALGDGRRRADAPVEPPAFPQGLPTGAEEQRQFLTEQCVASLHLCLGRFPQHYKSLYRLAFLYTHSRTHRVSAMGGAAGRGRGSSGRGDWEGRSSRGPPGLGGGLQLGRRTLQTQQGPRTSGLPRFPPGLSCGRLALVGGVGFVCVLFWAPDLPGGAGETAAPELHSHGADVQCTSEPVRRVPL